MKKKMARHPTPKISIMISELEEKIGLEIIQMNTNHMRSQLTSGSNFVTTHNTNGCWSLVKKVRPKYLPTVPVGKINKEGKLTTNQEGLKELYLETFLWRLRDRPIRPDLVDLQLIKSRMFETILKTCTKKRTDPWTLKQIEKVLDSLKKDKCCDPKGLINELFFTKVAGKDLKASLLVLFNMIKASDKIPAFMKIADIAAIYKGKGSKNNLNNERGIFIVSTYRSILMKLLYIDNIETIEKHMSVSQVGGRKSMNVRNHIWVLNGVIQDVLNRKGAEPIDIQIFDLKQCFDALCPEECLSDLYKYGVQDHTLNILYDGSLNTNIAIRTPVGVTERKQVAKTVMQGDIWAPSLCATSIDSIGKECLEENKYLYKYRENIEIPPLSMIDDLCVISSCGVETVKSNSHINYKISSKKLQCGTKKCKKMHIGRKEKSFICCDVLIDGWSEENFTFVETGATQLKDTYDGELILETSLGERYLGDIISEDGKNDKNLTVRKNKGVGIVNDIIVLLVEIMAGNENFEMATLLRNSCLVSSMVFNCEAWYRLTIKQIKILEKVDEKLMRKVLDCPSKTPIHLMYLELGWLPLRFINQSRRLNFLKYILDQKETSLMKQMFNEQKKKPKKYDWVKIVENDLKNLRIKLSYEDISSMTKLSFKKLVKKSCEENALNYLKLHIKSKGKELNYYKMELTHYLSSSSHLTLQEKKELFKIRTRMTDVKSNYKNKYESLNCDKCGTINYFIEETQEHVYKCIENKDNKKKL